MTKTRTRTFKLPALTAEDEAAGVRLYDTPTGPKLAFPPPVVAELHRNNPQNFCPKCHQHWSECKCVIEPTELPNKITQARPWGFKGAMVLPETHADHPCHKAKMSA